ncbi:ATP-binding protein [Cohnella sp.]|uniref:ATP-binding protein n=1 Tax=Cohnella sp. TaxID=1883426 RepID=UPI00356706B0
MRRPTIVWVTAILAAAVAAGVWLWPKPPESRPLADHGVIDLRSWDFREKGNVTLDGEWEFYPDRLLSPSEMQSVRPEHYIRVPSAWSESDAGALMNDKGAGTYRLKVLIDPAISRYGLKTTFIRHSSVIFVDDQEVARSGSPSVRDDDSYWGHNVPVTAFFKPKGDSFYLTIHAANWDFYRGGIIQNIYFGTQEDVRALELRTVILAVANVAFLLLSALYYLGIYLKRPQDRRFLYFALFCLGFDFVVFTTVERLFMQLVPSVPYLLVLKIKFIVIMACLCCLCAFIRKTELFFMPRRFMGTIVIGSLVYAALVPFLSASLLDQMMVVMVLVGLGGIEWLLLRAIALKRFGKSNARTAWQLFACVLMLFAQLSSITLYLNSQIFSDWIPVLTQLLFLGIVALMFSEQYSSAYDDLEVLSRKLVETDKLKDEFLIRTSHEFKTPLHGIMNLARAVIDQNENGLTVQQRENLSYIVSLSSRLSALVNDIIDFQSLRSGKIAMVKNAFDLNGTVQGTLDVLKHVREDGKVNLLNLVPANKHYPYADENRLMQILLNLVGNSLKYTDEGSVAISAESRGERVYIRVSDTGVGMTEELQSRLFRDARPDGDVNFTDIRSSGLGLQISGLLASGMGGKLYVKRSELGQGTIMELALPSANEGQRRELARLKPASAGEAGSGADSLLPARTLSAETGGQAEDSSKAAILLVDDEASNLKVLQELFPADKYRCLIAYDGQSALRLLQENRDVSLVLLDVMMPGLSGYETCRRIREEYPIYRLPVLLLTVRHSAADIAAGLDAGANDFLVKPFDSRELAARANTLLQMREAVRSAIRAEALFLQSQIKPHFIYNALSIMMSLCYKDGPRAGKLLGEFSNYLRLSFDLDPNRAKVSLKREISLVQSYAALEQARFGERLKIEWVIDEGLMEASLPALTLQPIVENAIRHGLMKRASGGVVRVEAATTDTGMRLKVRDDGVGIPSGKLERLLRFGRSEKGVGLINVHKRLLNEYGRGLEIESSEGEGTTVTIFVPAASLAERISG